MVKEQVVLCSTYALLEKSACFWDMPQIFLLPLSTCLVFITKYILLPSSFPCQSCGQQELDSWTKASASKKR